MEQFYKKEVKKALDYFDYLERDNFKKRLVASANQLKSLRLKKLRLERLQDDLKNHLKDVKKKIYELENKKKLETYSAKNVSSKSILINSLKNLEKQLGELSTHKEELLKKENNLFKMINELIKENKIDLRNIHESNVKELLKIKNLKKEKLIKQESLLEEELELFLKEKNLLERFGPAAKKRIFNLNKQINNLNDIKLALIKKVQLMDGKEDILKEKIIKAQEKKKSLEKDFERSIAKFGLINPKQIKKEVSNYLGGL